MSIRKVVKDFVSMGPLPGKLASAESIASHQKQLQLIEAPVTDEEAEVLIDSFGIDDCYGLAWQLLHLIETAPGGSPIKVEPGASENDWIRRLWQRSH